MICQTGVLLDSHSKLSQIDRTHFNLLEQVFEHPLRGRKATEAQSNQ